MTNKDIIAEGRRIIIEEKKAIENLTDSLDEKFAYAVKYIVNANKVIVSGVGKSGLIGQKISATLSSYGISSVFLHPVDALHGDIGVAQKGDVAILLSKSGTTSELIKMLPFLKSRIDKIISITGKSESPLANESDIMLNGFVEKEACSFNLAPTNSSTVSLVIGDALALAAMKYKNVTLEDFSKLHPLGQIGRNITLRVKDIMHKDDKIPLINQDVLFKEALIEMSEKKLGCVCMVDADNHLKGILTDGDIRRILQVRDEIKNIKVKDVMISSPVSIFDNLYLGEALSVMENRESQISVLPVINNRNQVVGIIRLHDIVRSGL
jgi:arabinose-5-phosphate isomerase